MTAIEWDPENPVYHEGIANLYMARLASMHGDPVQMRPYFELVLQLGELDADFRLAVLLASRYGPWESGVTGVALLAGLVLTALVAAARTLRTSRRAARRGLTLGALIGIASALIHATVEFAFQIPAVALAFTALLGIAMLAQEDA